jgi:uncharacterized integral membrane protein
MRFLFNLFSLGLMLLVTLCVVSLVLANRVPVTLSLAPLPYTLETPLYFIFVLSFLIGLIPGLWLYMGERIRHFLDARRLRRQLAAMHRND